MEKNLIGGYTLIDITDIEISAEMGEDGIDLSTKVFPIISSYITDGSFNRKIIDKPIIIKILYNGRLLHVLLDHTSDDLLSLYSCLYDDESGLTFNLDLDGMFYVYTHVILNIAKNIPEEEIDMTGLTVADDLNVIVITDTNNEYVRLRNLVGNYLVGYDSLNQEVIKGLITWASKNMHSAVTTIPDSEISFVTTWKILTK